MQARAIADQLRSERFDRIYSSDLVRASETARAIATTHDVRVHDDARLREFDFGEWEGLTWTEIAQRQPDLRDATDMIAAYRPPGGETIDDVMHRWESFYADLLRERLERVVVVTHAGLLHAIVRAMQPGGAKAALAGDFRFSPGSISRLTVDERGRAGMTDLNDVRHLDQVAADRTKLL